MDQIIRRHGYMGGRTESFHIGMVKKQLFYYDFTSLYPYALLDELPYGLPEFTWHRSNWLRGKQEGKTPQDWLDFFKNEKMELTGPIEWEKIKKREKKGWFFCFVRNVTKTKYPLHGMKYNGKLIFPNLDIWTPLMLHSEEVLYGMSLRDSITGKKIYDYKPLIFMEFKHSKFYERYIRFLYELKKIASDEKHYNSALRQLAKILINAAYGYLAIRYKDKKQLEVGRKNKASLILKHLENGSLINYNIFDKVALVRYQGQMEVKVVNTYVAAACTAFSRIHLHKIFWDVQKMGKKVFYCDTDSIVTDFQIEGSKLEKKWMANKGAEMGELKNEAGYGVSFQKAVFLGAKMYWLDGNTIEQKLKGLKKQVPKYEYIDPETKKIYLFFSDFQKNFFIKEMKKQTGLTYVPSPFKLKDNQKTPITIQEYILIARGWTLVVFSWKFFANPSLLFHEEHTSQIKKEENIEISFRSSYTKGNVNSLTGEITPLLVSKLD